MKKINDLKISVRLNIFLSLAVILILSVLGVYIYHVQYEKIAEDTDSSMNEQVNDLCNLVLLQIKERQSHVNSSINVADEILKNGGILTVEEKEPLNIEAKNQITGEKKTVRISQLFQGSKPLFMNFETVDKITGMTHTKATIFQKFQDGYIRISTTVLQSDGNRAVGTFIPNGSPVIQTIEKGSDFSGRAFVVDDWYLTTYRPIIVDNKIVGMLFVGMPEKDMKSLKDIFSHKKFLQSGYPFIVDKNGKLLIHPKKEGEIHKNDDFFQDILKSKSTYANPKLHGKERKR